MTKEGNNRCWPPLKTRRRNTGSDCKPTAASAAAKEVSVAAAVAAVLSELVGIFTLKETQNSSQDSFLGGHVFTLFPTVFGKSLVKHSAVRCS